jgi:hypothetical protein
MRRIARLVVILAVAAGVVSSGIAFAGGDPAHPFGIGKPPGHSPDGKPGKGCGDKNHRHYREKECRKPPK